MQATWMLTLIEVKMFFREKQAVFWTFLFPLVFLWIFGSFYNSMEIREVNFSQHYVPAWIAVNLLTTAFFTLGTILTVYREQDILRRFRISPLEPWMILLAHTLHGLFIFVISIFILLIFGYLFYDLTFPKQIWSTVFAVILSTCAIFPLGMFFTSLAKSTRTASAISSVFLNISIFLSGATFPVDVLPYYLKVFAKLLPLYYAVEFIRGTWNGNHLQVHQQEIIILSMLSIVTIFLSVKYFKWSKQEV
ncbi:ABC transporter permease [Melghirimyces algeriensis]|uniref:Transport permease protein n=1 Tax=Melghirimyces algeriensis TaxID=910412 RepID=A0A521F0I9_9BACL|nr:ABC transporter permease [Melghirimyces algeriensis]SMO89734.1 ABC-2 type transport system permease protein [Melghirimyces algeriensis]